MVKHGREDIDEIDTDLFYGEANQGIPLAEFERNIVSCLTEKYGMAYGKQMWENTLLNLRELDPWNNDLHEYDFHHHLTLIFDIMCEKNSKLAMSLFNSPRFWTIKYQLDWRDRQYEKMYCHIQKQCGGEALRQVESLGIESSRELRAHFKLRFGGAQSAMIKAREVAYSAGMKKVGDKFAIMPFSNLETKLNQLETERTFFWKTCPVECRKDYVFGHESKLTHVVIEHLPVAYDSTVKNVKNAVKLRKMMDGDKKAGYTTGQDLAMQTFSSD